jgi:hypothetical protein
MCANNTQDDLKILLKLSLTPIKYIKHIFDIMPNILYVVKEYDELLCYKLLFLFDNMDNNSCLEYLLFDIDKSDIIHEFNHVINSFDIKSLKFNYLPKIKPDSNSILIELEKDNGDSEDETKYKKKVPDDKEPKKTKKGKKKIEDSDEDSEEDAPKKSNKGKGKKKDDYAEEPEEDEPKKTKKSKKKVENRDEDTGDDEPKKTKQGKGKDEDIDEVLDDEPKKKAKKKKKNK